MNGEPVLLMHSDGLYALDVSYMKLRRWLHNPLSLLILRNLPLSTRQKLGTPNSATKAAHRRG